MSKQLFILGCWMLQCVLTSGSHAQTANAELKAVPATDAEPNLRELFVPFNDLPLILGNETRRVFMTRQELDELKRSAKRAPDEVLPQQIALLSAAYTAALEPGRAILQGELSIEVLADGLHALPLKLSGVGIRQASIDGHPARLWKSDDGLIQLITSGRGVHSLKLELTVPVTAAAAQQSLSLQVPNPPTTTFHLTVPGNVEMKSGASIINRRVDDEAMVTHFDLLPSSETMNLVMSLNNKRLRDETTVLARGVLISEVTSGYQRLHATLSMNVLHGATDEFRIQLPADYEVTQVTTPLLARWNIQAADTSNQTRILVIKLRELATSQVVIQLRADRLSSQLDNWQIPQVEPLSVAGFASVVGVLLEEQLASQPLESQNLIPIDNAILTAALPASVLVTEPGTPKVRPLATYYAADTGYQLQTSFVRPPARVRVSSTAVLTVGDRALDIEGSLVLTPESEKLFAFDFLMPKDWSLVSVSSLEDIPLEYERHADDAGWRVRVRLPGLARNELTTIKYRASVTPATWLSDWTEQELQLPHFEAQPSDTAQQTGAIALRAIDDLSVQPLTTAGLIVISEQEKAQYGCAHVPVNLAWRFTSEKWQASIKIVRKTPRLVGRALSFFQVTPDALFTHYELFYDVDTARSQRLEFSLPATTPSEITLRGLGDTQVKESSSQEEGDRRKWTVTLAEKRTGRLRLAINFTQPLTDSQLANLTLPDVVTLNTEYQSGLVAVEGHSELDITVGQHPRAVDMGELVDAEYQPGKRLLGVYSYVGNAMQVVLKAERRAIHALPTTIVERAELVSLIGNGSMTQTAARYALRTKAQYLEIQLPADAELWSIMVDGTPALPERQDERIVVSLPVIAVNQLRDLRVVYEQASRPLSLRGSVQLSAPLLWQRAERNTDRQPVPTADLHWEAVLPIGYKLVRTAGTVAIAPADQPLGFQPGQLLPRVSLPRGRYDRQAAEFTQSEAIDRFQAYDTQAPAPNANVRDRAPITSAQLADKLPEEPVPLSAETANQPATPQAQTATPLSAGDFAAGDQIAAGALQPGQSWAIEGLRCLDIDLTPARFGQSIRFDSLGVEPTLDLTLINAIRWRWLGAVVGIGMILLSLLSFHERQPRFQLRPHLRLVGFCILVAFLVPLIMGWEVEFQPIIEGALAGGLAVMAIAIPLFVVHKVRARRARRRTPVTALSGSAASSILIGLALSLSSAQGQDQPPTPIANLDELAAAINALPDKTPVSIPADAIVVPYDPAGELPANRAALGKERILVPYETYTRLWNAAHPTDSLTNKAPVVPYAWADAKYETTLDDLETLTITGTFSVEVYGDQSVSVPLALSGGVLESLQVDGQPGKVQLVEAITPANQPPAEAAQATSPDVPKTSLLLLHLSGKGTKQLAMSVRMKVERRGGWRAVEGRLPTAPATRLIMKVIKPGSEVRLNHLADRAINDIQSANHVIDTALSVDGQVNWQWRTKIAEAAIDQGLSVESNSVFDIQEDGLHFVWQGSFVFRSGRRESFSILVPGDYLVEQVVGSNLRGWTVARVGDSQQLTIDLLAAVTQRETLTVFLYRHQELGAANSNTKDSLIAVPSLKVPDAMVQRGQLTVRRSRLLDIRSGAMSGLSRIDTPDNHPLSGIQSDASPLPLDTFQAFQFSQVPYSYELNVQASRSLVRVTGHTLQSLSQLDSSLESQLKLEIQQRPLYHVRLSVPAAWQLEPPSIPVPYEWTRVTADNQQTVDIYLASGASGSLPIVLRGKLEQGLDTGADGTIPAVPLPKISVQDVQQQTGEIVVISDPAYAVVASQLVNCETGLVDSAAGWLAPQHKLLAQVLVRYTDSNYSGQWNVSQRTPQVKAFSVSNVKLTDRSIEETLYFEFSIRTAGIRQLSLVMPAWLSGARVRGPMIRNQTWTPVTSDAGSPVRLQVELQEEVMGQYSLVIEHDRLLTAQNQQAPIPIIETGTTEHRFVTLENSGRDELVIEKISGMERLQRSQSQWNVLASLLGGKTTEAFVVTQAAADASSLALTYSTKDRTRVETVGARIGIAQTFMVVDENGIYRASQELRMENRTEQTLEIELPAGAQLWTATVAGDAVKPMLSGSNPTSATGGGLRVRLPLVKTATGDLDYPIVIKYGGQVTKPGALRTLRFPLARTININVELSQVRLRLPPGMRWWNFGGSMSRVTGEDELQAGWISFRTRQLMELTQLASQTDNDDFSRARALNNLKELGREVQVFQSQSQTRGTNSLGQLGKSLDLNSSAWFEAEKELNKPAEIARDQASSIGNRALLSDRVSSQTNGRSYNVANSAQENFADTGEVILGQGKDLFNSQWLAGNALNDQAAVLDNKAKGNATESRIITNGLQLRDRSKLGIANKPGAASEMKQQADVADKLLEFEDRAGKVQRYQMRLEQQAAGRTPGASPYSQIQSGIAGGGTTGLPNDAVNGPPSGMMGGMMGGGLGAAMGGEANQVAPQKIDRSLLAARAGGMPGANNELDSRGYLASLDMQLPVRGEEFFFTTPRGATEITAQSISNQFMNRWLAIAGLIFIGLVFHRLTKAR